jgi:hypothetical protein
VLLTAREAADLLEDAIDLADGAGVLADTPR